MKDQTISDDREQGHQQTGLAIPAAATATLFAVLIKTEQEVD